MNVLNFKQGIAATMMFSEEEKIKNYFLPFFLIVVCILSIKFTFITIAYL